MVLRPIDLIVESENKVTIVVPDVCLKNQNTYTLRFHLTSKMKCKLRKAIGTEKVYIQVGIDGDALPLIDQYGNVFYTNKLTFGGYCYKIAYGNNGLPEKIAHFICCNPPRCCISYDPANNIKKA